ncbi:uncharacterized protein ASCRUDRAFT_70919 [Ascoidea rubescens DSM 1968]|uniref:Uncharacterized protein n=1 Tax=Ascoidea rubescens DSM 1968 TaxID=1344418 RepID=A0A1D2VFP1_9ASCO|nr:hypothetical protein ASCRUDRAFT_70919 [Ascoidea rubescens DSM 1968]ODV60402.1 hypothetical protein ASCRUDRAFT_70919 [Ascoidea rubescens DSM 1968]
MSEDQNQGQAGAKDRGNSNSSSNRQANNPKTTEKRKNTNNRSRRGNKLFYDGLERNQVFKLQEIKYLIQEFAPITVNGKAIQTSTGSQRDEMNTDERTTDGNQSKNSNKRILKMIKEILIKNNDSVMYLTLLVKPSDPDFIYDLDSLKINLNIPVNYPIAKKKNGKNRPSIVVLNDNIPRGFLMNIEFGFKELVNQIVNETNKNKNKHKSKEKDNNQKSFFKLVGGNNLLGMIKSLDCNLETFLSQKESTIVSVSNFSSTSIDSKNNKIKSNRKENETDKKNIGAVHDNDFKYQNNNNNNNIDSKTSNHMINDRSIDGFNYINKRKKIIENTLYKIQKDPSIKMLLLNSDDFTKIQTYRLNCNNVKVKLNIPVISRPITIEEFEFNKSGNGSNNSNSNAINDKKNIVANFNKKAIEFNQELEKDITSNETNASLIFQINYLLSNLSCLSKPENEFEKFEKLKRAFLLNSLK